MINISTRHFGECTNVQPLGLASDLEGNRLLRVHRLGETAETAQVFLPVVTGRRARMDFAGGVPEAGVGDQGDRRS
jgi:hypothetical protein